MKVLLVDCNTVVERCNHLLNLIDIVEKLRADYPVVVGPNRFQHVSTRCNRSGEPGLDRVGVVDITDSVVDLPLQRPTPAPVYSIDPEADRAFRLYCRC